MAITDDIVNILTDFGTKLKEDTQQSLRDKGVTFGGQDSRLSARLKFNITNESGIISFRFYMPDYAGAIDTGRIPAPVSKAGQESISKWVKRKGIVGDFQSQNLADRLAKQAHAKSQRRKKALQKLPFDKATKALTFLIARKIKAKGIEGNHFYHDVINDGRLDKLQEALSKIITTGVRVEIINAIE